MHGGASRPNSSESKSSDKGKAPQVELPITSRFISDASSLLQPPTLAVTTPTPGTTPGRPTPNRSHSDPQLLTAMGPPAQSPSNGSAKSYGKRKANDDVDTTPPDPKKGAKATFTIPADPRGKSLSCLRTASYILTPSRSSNVRHIGVLPCTLILSSQTCSPFWLTACSSVRASTRSFQPYGSQHWLLVEPR
jgi:hypothetical protein